MRTTTLIPPGLVESPVLSNGHAGFGGRPKETGWSRDQHRASGRPYVVLVHGARADVEALREEVADVLRPLGLRLSPAKTQVVHMSDGFDFLGFHIQWKRKRGTNKWHVYTFIADRPIRSLKAKVRALTNRTSQQNPRDVLIRLNQIMRGWANYFKHAVAKHTFHALHQFVWWRVIRWLRTLHRWRWKDVRRRFTTRWAVEADHGGRDRVVQPRGDAGHPLSLPGQHHPQPLDPAQPRHNGTNRGEPGAVKVARRVRRAAWGNGPAAMPTPRPRPTQPSSHRAGVHQSPGR
jgi:RNA-directed DNA polymerase